MNILRLKFSKNKMFHKTILRNINKFLKKDNYNSEDSSLNESVKNKINSNYDFTKHSLLKHLYMFGYNTDNIGYILHEPSEKLLIGVDFGDFAKSKSIVEKLESNLDSKLRYIFTTHIHDDHCGGNLEWKSYRGSDIQIISGNTILELIPGSDKLMNDLETMTIGELCIACMHTPGHTKSAVSYIITHVAENSNKIPLLFSGDTLFIGGCGRVFNGSHAELYESLKKLTYLPNDTLVFPGHEYAKKNLEFCMKLDPNNDFLKDKYEWVEKTTKIGDFTVGGRLIEERLYNPFLRAGDEYYLSLTGENDPQKSFTKIRILKDKF